MKKIMGALSVFTTAKASGTVARDILVFLGTIITMMGMLGVLTPSQVFSLQRTVDAITSNWPQILSIFGAIMTVGTTIYRAAYMSSSDKAAEAAKAIDDKLPKNADVEILTPGAAPNIVIEAK